MSCLKLINSQLVFFFSHPSLQMMASVEVSEDTIGHEILYIEIPYVQIDQIVNYYALEVLWPQFF
jgi:hypothetical protein